MLNSCKKSTIGIGEGGAGVTVEICANLIQVAIIFFANGKIVHQLNHSFNSMSRAPDSAGALFPPHQREYSSPFCM